MCVGAKLTINSAVKLVYLDLCHLGKLSSRSSLTSRFMPLHRLKVLAANCVWIDQQLER